MGTVFVTRTPLLFSSPGANVILKGESPKRTR